MHGRARAVEERHDDDRRLHKNRVAGGGRAREAEQLRQLAEEQVEAGRPRHRGRVPFVGVRRTHSAGRPPHRTQQQEHERADGVARQVRGACRAWVLIASSNFIDG